EEGHQSTARALEVLRMDELKHAATDELVLLVADHPCRGWAGVDDRAGQIEQGERLPAVLDELAKPLFALAELLLGELSLRDVAIVDDDRFHARLVGEVGGHALHPPPLATLVQVAILEGAALAGADEKIGER